MSTRNRIIVVLTITVLVGLPLACKPIQENSGEPATGALPGGTYNLISIDGHPIPYAPMHDGGQAPEVAGGSLTINRDGTFICNIKFSDPNIVAGEPSGEAKGQPGTFTRDGNTLMLKHPGAGYTPVTIASDTLTMNNEGMLFVFQKEVGTPVSVAAEKQSGTRTPEKVLDQLLGTWSQETTAFKAKWTPEEKRTTQTWTATHVLSENFVLLKVKDEQEKFGLQLFTYDQQKKCYQLWTFDSTYGGPDTPIIGQWDEATRTIKWSGMGSDGNKSSSQMRFINADKIITTLMINNVAGDLLLHMEFKATRLKEPLDQSLSVVESNAPNFSQAPEQKVLDGLLGNWNCEVTLKTLGSNPETKQSTEKHTMTRVLNGSFVQETVESSLGNSVLILYTFDQKKQYYRLWGFNSEQEGSDF